MTLARATPDVHIDAELPVRAVFATDLSGLRYVGFLSSPEIAYQNDRFLGGATRIKLGIGATFADAEFLDEMYGVRAQFATATRPAYSAKFGYLGTKLQLSWLHPVTERFRVVGLVRGDFHHGAANDESPLFRTTTTSTVIVGAIWMFARSRAVVVE